MEILYGIPCVNAYNYPKPILRGGMQKLQGLSYIDDHKSSLVVAVD